MKRLETAIVDHVSMTWRLVTCKVNNDVDMSPAGLLLLVSRDGSRKEVDCDPEDKLGEHRASYSKVYILLTTICVCMVSTGLCVGIHTGSEP